MMKRSIFLIGIVCMVLMAGFVSGASDDKNLVLRPVTFGNISTPDSPPPFGNVPGGIMDDKVYTMLEPCYTDNLIQAYGPVPVFAKDHQILSRGILGGYSVADRNTWYKTLDNFYESTKDSFNAKYAYPRGPVISFGYNALGSVTVGIYEKAAVDRKILDEMHSALIAESGKQGIDNLPVIMYSEPMPRLDLGRTDMWRPVIGGVQTGTPSGALTVGFAGTRRGQLGFVTSGHGGGSEQRSSSLIPAILSGQ